MIAGVVLAAGQSRRMGSPKLTLPWKGGQTVIEAVVGALRAGGLSRILVVVGGDRQAVARALAGFEVEIVDNPEYAAGEMLSSIQWGLRAMGEEPGAAMLMPGDLPAIRPATVRAVAEAWRQFPEALCVPAHGGRRGHPVLVPRGYWPGVLALGAGDSLRAFLRAHIEEIRRVEVEDPGIHTDIDTPEDYSAIS